MTNRIIISLMMAAGLLTASCDRDDTFTAKLPAGDGILEVDYRFDGGMPLSRGMATQPHETDLRQAHILFFNPDDADTDPGTFVGYSTVAVPGGKSKFSFDPPETLLDGVKYRVIALGNGDSFVPDGSGSLAEWLSTYQGTYKDALGELTAVHSGIFTRNTPGVLPMFGNWVDENDRQLTFTISRNAEGVVTVTEKGAFLFSRAVCRFDIHNLVGHLLKIESARLVNTRNAGLYLADGINAGDVEPLSTSISKPAGDGSDGYMPVTTDMTPGVTTTQRLEASLYGFPNTVNTTVQNDKSTTALIIAGYYYDSEKGTYDDKLTFYRFNYANVGESQALKRNYCYRATIKGVKRRGADDEKGAYNDSSPIFDYDVDEEWGTTDDNFTSDKDGNFLVVSKTHLTFDGDANESDFIELRVSTNPELTWTVEPVDEEGNENTKFTFEKLDNNSVKCGPNEKNETDYVRYGYYQIRAVNPKTGADLKMKVYLMQLSTKYNVKTLTVNGNTGEFEQLLNPMGGSVLFKVVTGSNDNPWDAVDSGDHLMNWDTQGIYFTNHGNNNTTLEIRVPANITGETREATLIVSLTNDPDNKVKPVTIKLKQEPSPQLMDIINFPASGEIILECLDLSDGNPNGIAQYRSFPVRLTDPANYRYEVTSNFDKDIDLVLSYKENVGPLSLHPVYADQSAGHRHDDKLTECEHGNAFYINAFRTGPGDPEITGTITVKAYNPSDPNARTEERSFTVKLHSEKCNVNDVVILNGESNILLADRNLGAVSRIQPDGVIATARYYSTDDFFKITGLTGQLDPTKTDNYLGIVQDNTYGSKNNTEINFCNSNIKVTDCPQLFFSDNNHVNSFYAENVWKCPTSAEWNTIIPKIRFSKWRPFVLSDLKDKSSGKELPVACWLPYRKTEKKNNNDMPAVQPTACGYACDPLLVGNHLTFFNYLYNGTCVSQTYPNRGNIANDAKCYLLLRLCRSLTPEETERYKTEILGY